jgi:hypothetical protein
MKEMCAKLSLKKYLNEPPFAHRLNPLLGLFLKLDSSIDAPELERLFFKNVMNMELFQSQLWASLN